MNLHSTDGTQSPEEEIDNGTLADIEFRDGKFVSAGDEIETEEAAKRDRFRESLERIASPERFHDVVRLIYCWTGRAIKVRSLEIGEHNEDFREACDLLYVDLKDSFLGPIIDDMDTETLHRWLVYGAGFGMPIVQASKEVSDRKRKAKDEALQSDDQETQKDDDDEKLS